MQSVRARCGRRTLVTMGLVAWSCAGSAQASDFALYGSHTTGSISDWGLVQFNVPVTGQSTRVGQGGLMFDSDFSSSGTLFAPGAFGLSTVDLETGEQTLIGDWGLGDKFMVSIAFAPDGTLYGVDNEGLDTSLYTISTTTGLATWVGRVDGFVFGLDFDPFGNLYGAAGDVFEINPLTGAMGSTLIPYNGAFVTGLDYGADGVFRGVENFAAGGGSTLQFLDLETGSMSLIGPASETGLEGIASIPSPGATLLIAAGIVAFGQRRRNGSLR